MLKKTMAGICRTAMSVKRALGTALLDKEDMRVSFDDSIIAGTAVEKQQDMTEVTAGRV